MADVNSFGFYHRLAEEQRRENGGRQFNVREPTFADGTTLLKVACLLILFLILVLVNYFSTIWHQHRLDQRVRELDREHDHFAADFETDSDRIQPSTNDKVEHGHEHEHTD